MLSMEMATSALIPVRDNFLFLPYLVSQAFNTFDAAGVCEKTHVSRFFCHVLFFAGFTRFYTGWTKMNSLSFFDEFLKFFDRCISL